jgi:UPF0755 protein
VQPVQPTIAPQPIQPSEPGLTPTPRWWKNRKRVIILTAVSLVVLILVVAGTIAGWYTQAIRPLGKDTNQYIAVDVEKGMTPTAIGQLLQQKKVIRSATAFIWYTRLTHTGDQLQYGDYRLSPSESVATIVKHLTSGDVDTLKITFLPGATLADDKAALIDAGYSQTEVDTAFAATYTGLVFQDKPVSASLEGYIYGETYFFNNGTSVSDILKTTFDTYSQVVKDNDLIALYKAQGLNLYQGITLASIVEREMGATGDENTPTSDQKQVAQVFYLRLSQGIPLGSDVTYQYAAKLMGVTPSPSLDSPYNTRLYAGLPPGPIATPSKSALLATADPASGTYLYFLSGDDGKTYFATTNAQHEANIAAHCQVKCAQEQ